jgi:very-short-patch-repair endonuclease
MASAADEAAIAAAVHALRPRPAVMVDIAALGTSTGRRAGIRAAALPQARTNVRVAGWLVDAVWDRERIVVEVDGYRFHRTRAKFERDRRMDGRLLMAGYRVLRVTWRQLTHEPELVVAMIATALAVERS